MVLTVQTMEIAACAGNGQAGGARMEMIERFLLYRVNGKRTRLGIHLTDEHPFIITTTATNPRLAIGNPTVMRTEQASDCPTLQSLIISALVFFQFSILNFQFIPEQSSPTRSLSIQNTIAS